MSENGVDLFDNRRDALIASVGDERRIFYCRVSPKPGNPAYDDDYYGLAKSENQFRQAVAAEVLLDVEKVPMDKIRKWKDHEFAAMAAKEKSDG